MLDKVFETIVSHRMITNGDKVIVALSGGPDSVTLLYSLLALSDRLGISIFALHVNHMLRGAESDGDEAYVSDLCKKNNIPLEICRHDIRLVAESNGISLEEAGRNIRYEQLEAYAGRLGAQRIALA
ncbi:MAG: tRNA(Ile)-lysidine synthetase, partial [Clostridiales bacterium]|nr:tRNA(Ile)-lysidine synthetase [Clostridiales bacterium]